MRPMHRPYRQAVAAWAGASADVCPPRFPWCGTTSSCSSVSGRTPRRVTGAASGSRQAVEPPARPQRTTIGCPRRSCPTAGCERGFSTPCGVMVRKAVAASFVRGDWRPHDPGCARHGTRGAKQAVARGHAALGSNRGGYGTRFAHQVTSRGVPVVSFKPRWCRAFIGVKCRAVRGAVWCRGIRATAFWGATRWLIDVCAVIVRPSSRGGPSRSSNCSL